MHACWGQVSPVALHLQFCMYMWRACRGLKLAPGLFLHHLSLYILRQGLLPNPGFAGSASLSLTACSRIPSLCLPRDEIKGGLRYPTSFYVGSRYLDPCPHTYIASSVPAESATQPFTWFFKTESLTGPGACWFS